MDESMRLYWEAVKENYTNELLIHKSSNPVRDFEEELIEGPILELGSGQSPLILEYCQKGKEIFAVDNDEYQLEELRERISELNCTSKINFINATVLKDQLPQNLYSLIIISNLLHFFTMEECTKFVDELIRVSTQGTLVYLVCHSTKHTHNNPENPENNDYFKHYFSENDLNTLFKKENFERIFFADIQRINSKFETTVIEKWLHKIFDKQGNNDTTYREKEIREYIGDNKQADLVCIYRRK